MDNFFQEISDDDHDCDEFLKDENGAYCFDNYWQAAALVDDAILTMKSEV